MRPTRREAAAPELAGKLQRGKEGLSKVGHGSAEQDQSDDPQSFLEGQKTVWKVFESESH